MQWQKVALVGVGLLGGSLGQALLRRGLAANVQGYVRRPEAIQECVHAKAVVGASCDLEAVVKDADLVVLGTPIAQMRDLAARMAPALKPGSLVTDVGSVKGSVVRDLEPLIAAAGAVFIGSHPMAGAERMGVAAARPGLFEEAVCVITPTTSSPAAALACLENLWRGVGAIPLLLAPEIHDELVSRSSHLPHVLAAALASYVLDPARPAEQARLCATGFRDTTRIAAGSPEMWRDIALANQAHLARALEDLIGQLQGFRQTLAAGDPAALQAFFANAKRQRDQLPPKPSTSAE